jgi:glycosyltransferase involved in cell wall biosynthesis
VDSEPGHSALLVADARGYILERLGRAWIANNGTARHELVLSAETHPYLCCREGARLGAIHWIDQLKFRACAPAVTVPQVVECHHLTEPEVPVMLAKLPYADGITTSSLRWKRKLEAFTGREVFLIPYTLDTRAYVPAADPGRLRREAGIGDDEHVLGFVGNAGANAFGRKGIDVLLKVLEGAASRWDDLRVVLVGVGWEALTGRIESLGIRVLRRQFATAGETSAAYPLMDALLTTSSEEGGPCTTLEAMACGVPVITSDVGHIPEVVTDGETGFICPTRSVEEYLSRIAALRADPALRARVAAQARAFVERERDDRAVLPRIDFDRLYEEAAARFRARSATELAMRALRQAALGARYAGKILLRRNGK